MSFIESVRENGKVRQKTVANLGRLEEFQEQKLDRLIEGLAKFSKKRWIQAEAADLLVRSAREWGTELVFGHLWDKLGLAGLLEHLLGRTEIDSPLDKAVYVMVLNRIGLRVFAEPRRKGDLQPFCIVVRAGNLKRVEWYRNDCAANGENIRDGFLESR